jgi:hypothetical protein
VSGGSFNYACEFGNLKDLWVEKSGIEGIADALRDRGHESAAAETEALLAELAVFEDYLLARAERLRNVWKAAEWVVSGDWSDGDLVADVGVFESAPPFADTVRIDTATGRIVK